MSKTKQPLAVRMRPSSLREVVGQDHIIGEGKILTKMVETGHITSILLFGPPGVGKTSIAHALSCDLGVNFGYFNAGVHAKKELQTLVEKATPEEPVVILIDEVHRLDKTKQDFLLMHMEEGSLITVGATTENPYISINPALRSRSHIFELKAVTPEDVVKNMKRALTDKEKGLGDQNIIISDDDLLYIASQTGGDMRSALNQLDLAVTITEPNGNEEYLITREIINQAMQRTDIGGDKDGDSHYNLLSAFQKSIRGSDADAALHYLARLIQAGDMISILRRLVVIAYEDISLADPSLGAETLAAVKAAERVGLPEARIPLAQITVRLALSPKSNVAYKALDKAIEALKSGRSLNIPKHLQDAHYKGAAKLGRGVDYKYPHDYPFGIVEQNYLPDAFRNDQYLEFRDETDTTQISERYRATRCVIGK